MRFPRTIALAGVGLLWFGLGPVVLVLAALALLHPATRDRLRPGRRVVLAGCAAAAVLAGLVVVVPDGWVRIPPGPGAWVTPAYVGRPADAGAGPAGESPTVTSKKYDVGDCTDLVADAGRLVALCGGTDPELRLLDPVSLRTKVTTRLPGSGCAGRVAAAGGVVVASSARRLALVDPTDLAVSVTVDLSRRVGDGDCVTGVGIEGGRPWFVTRAGVVGVVVADGVRTTELHDRVERPLSAAAEGVYVAGEQALHRVDLVDGRPRPTWRAAYDGGSRGSAPVVLPHGLVAVADNRDPRLQVVVHRAGTGDVVCRVELFGDDEGSTDGGLAAAGDGVVVTNAHGYDGPRSTVLGRTTDRGIARVGPDCSVSWTTGMDSPSGAPAVADGVVYAWTKRHSWLGVDAWYLSALDLRTGRLVWARRTGLTPLSDNAGGAVVLGPGHAAYAPVLGGFVRVADRG